MATQSVPQTMDSLSGTNMWITSCSSKGDRQYNEDRLSIVNQTTADGKSNLFTYFGIFDGHGGTSAANYAKGNLMDTITTQVNFWSDDDALVEKSIRDGFIRCHQEMWRSASVPGAPKRWGGTTATIGFIRRGKLFVGHAGDSRMVLGESFSNKTCNMWAGRDLTNDHKPSDPVEQARIINSGGAVGIAKEHGILRVMRDRPIPYSPWPNLAIARSLGDFWSYNPETMEFAVSPVPDTAVLDFIAGQQRCLILASDGLWDAIETPQEAVEVVQNVWENNQKLKSNGTQNVWKNPSKELARVSIKRSREYEMKADNTSVITVIFENENTNPTTFDSTAVGQKMTIYGSAATDA